MLTLGIDLAAGSAHAVVLDAEGGVNRRVSAASLDLLLADDQIVRGPAVTAVGIAVEWADTDSPRLDLPPSLAALPRRVVCTPGTAAVVAEAWSGAARGAQHVVCLHSGSRVIAGILLGGQPWSGAHGHAGTAAWLAINPADRQDYKKLGSLAAEVSESGLVKRLSWRIQAGDDSAVLARAGGLDAITAAHVYESAKAGDGVAISVVRDTARYVAMALVNLAVTLDPDVVVLGGRILAAGDLLTDTVRQEWGRRLPPGFAPRIRFEISTLADDAIALGAARLAMLARA